MKKTILLFLSIFTLTVLVIVIYDILPLEVKRKSDITLGNELIKNINSYHVKNNILPNSNDMKTLKEIGFKIEMLGVKPNYECNQDDEYEIVFLEGFDGPYLMWNSREKKWKLDNPTIFTKGY